MAMVRVQLLIENRGSVVFQQILVGCYNVLHTIAERILVFIMPQGYVFPMIVRIIIGEQAKQVRLFFFHLTQFLLVLQQLGSLTYLGSGSKLGGNSVEICLFVFQVTKSCCKWLLVRTPLHISRNLPFLSRMVVINSYC